MSRRTACLVAILILISIVYPATVSFASEEITAKFTFESEVVEALGIPDAPVILISLKEGSLVFVKELEESLRIPLGDYGIVQKMDYIKRKKIVVAGTSKGYILLIDPLLGRIVEDIKVFDGPIKLLEATNDGRYVVFTAKKRIVISGVRVDAESLIVYDLERHVTVFYRDWYSKDRLAKVFKLKISDDDKYLVVETLDKFCELCEMLEAKTEIYDLKSMRKIYSKSLGLSISMDIIGSLKVLSTRRWLRAQGYITQVNIVEVTNEGEVVEREFKLDFNTVYVSFLNENEFFIMLAEPRKGTIGYIYSIKGHKIRNIKGYDIGAAKREEESIIIATSKKITLYNLNMGVVWVKDLNLEIIGKAVPLFIGTCNKGEYVYVIFRKSLYVFLRKITYNLRIEVYDIQGKGLERAYIVIFDETGKEVVKGYSDDSGVFVAKLPAGFYKLYISLSGYINQTHSLDLREDLTLKITLESVRVEDLLNYVNIRILSENNEPIEGAYLIVSLPDGTILLKLPIPKEGGTVVLKDGVYNFTVIAPGFYTETMLIKLPGISHVEFRLRFMRSNLTVCVVNAPFNYTVIHVKGRNGYYEKRINSSNSCIVFYQIPVGFYEVKASAGDLYEISKTIDLRENSIIRMIFQEEENNKKMENMSGRMNLSEIISYFGKRGFLVTRNGGRAFFFKARSNEGNIVDLDDFKGKVIILDFFYTQCEGCKHVIPLLREIKEKYGDSVALFSITVSQSDTPSIIEAYVNEHNITWTVLHDDVGIYQMYNVTIFPTLIIIGPDGRIAYRIEGSYVEVEESKRQLVTFITGVLAAVNQNPDYTILLLSSVLLIFAVAIQYYVSTFSEEEEIDEYGEEFILEREAEW